MPTSETYPMVIRVPRSAWTPEAICLTQARHRLNKECLRQYQQTFEQIVLTLVRDTLRAESFQPRKKSERRGGRGVLRCHKTRPSQAEVERVRSDPPEIMTLLEASSYLDMTMTDVSGLARKGNIPCRRTRAVYLFRRDDIVAYYEKATRFNVPIL